MVMPSSILDIVLGAGMNAFDDAAAAPVTANPEETPAVPSVDVTVCEEELSVVEAATEAVAAETALINSAAEVQSTDKVVCAQVELVAETAEVVASMESLIGSPMSKADALALRMRVVEATRGQYKAEQVVGSVESFGTDIATDDALEAGLEGIGEFLVAAKNKLSNLVTVLRQRVSGFFKDAFVSFDKVAKRADAVERLAKGTTGESNSSAIQLPIDTAQHLVKDGKLVQNLAALITELSKTAEVVMKENNTVLADHRKEFISLVNPLATVDLEGARGIAKKVADWKLPKPDYAKTKIQTSSRTTEQFRGDVLPGDEALYVTYPAISSSSSDSLSDRLDNVRLGAYTQDVCLKEVAKKPNKLDLAVDTLKPAEIVKITETINGILSDIKLYSKTWTAWDQANTELDRLISILVSVQWEGDAEEYEGSMTYNATTTVFTSTLNMRLADAVYYINMSYGYMSTQPVMLLSKKLIVVMNRILEVCERSLATYSDNSLK
jgi:hypothetical protein